MRERPILFAGPLITPIMADVKTQTRRALRVQPPGEWAAPGRSACPYGVPGDRLWVRETFFAFGRWETRFDAKKGRDAWHFVDMTVECGHGYHYAVGDACTIVGAKGPGGATPMWWKRPAIFMPRAASRILLEITDVRVERLQAISEDDAKAEGCERLQDDEPGYVERYEPDWKICPQCGGTRLYTAFGANLGAQPDTDCTRCDTYAKRYRHLWDSINGSRPGMSWADNPFVWAVGFRRIKQ